MRTHILIATAVILSAAAAHAAPRSLSGAQGNPVEAPVQKIQILEAPQPAEQPRLEAPRIELPKAELPSTEPSKAELPKAAEQTPATDTGPVRAAPIEDKAVAAKPTETAPVAAKPAEASPAPVAKSVKQARRKQPRQHATSGPRIEREFRTIGRAIERHIGFALSTAALYSW
jgi:hypothetical protein